MRSAASVALEQVHRRRADERGDEHVRRPVVERPAACRTAGASRRAAPRRGRPSVIASIWSWVTYSVATPMRRWMRETSARICTRSFASRFESGSSIRNTLGSRTIARPIATRWRWPPESWPGLRSSHSVSPRIAGRLADPRRRSRPWASCASAARSRCSRRRSCAGRARSSGRPSRRRDPRGDVVDDALADPDRARRDRLEPGDHPQHRRLAAARRPDDDHELAVGDHRGRGRGRLRSRSDRPC